MAAPVVTTLNGDITMNAQKVRLTAFTNPSAGGMSAPTKMFVDGEIMYITDATLTPVVSVSRGMEGTLASAHKTLAPVRYGLTSDFTQTVSTDGFAAAPVVSYGVSGAITVPVVDQTIYLTKAGVAVMTLVGPATDQTNTVKIISLTANAHTVTYTAGWYQNTTSSDVLTFPATSGACFTFQAMNGVWNAIATADDGALLG